MPSCVSPMCSAAYAICVYTYHIHIQWIPESWNMGLGGFVLGPLVLYLKGMRRMVFQVSGFYYIHICIYVHIYIHRYIFNYTYTHINIYTYTHTNIYTYAEIHACIHAHTCTDTYIHLHLHLLHLHLHTYYIYICIYIYIYIYSACICIYLYMCACVYINTHTYIYVYKLAIFTCVFTWWSFSRLSIKFLVYCNHVYFLCISLPNKRCV